MGVEADGRSSKTALAAAGCELCVFRKEYLSMCPRDSYSVFLPVDYLVALLTAQRFAWLPLLTNSSCVPLHPGHLVVPCLCISLRHLHSPAPTCK